MNEQEVLEVFKRTNALLQGHFVLKSGRHSGDYLNKDMLYVRPSEVIRLGWDIALRFAILPQPVETVVGPAIGGIILSQWVANGLDRAGQPVAAIYAEKEDDRFVFRRGYGQFVQGRRVLVVEDILTTGDSAKKVVAAVLAAGGKVVGVGALCNRGGVTAKNLGVPDLFALTKLNLLTWGEADCPLCREGVPISTEVGHGKEFLAQRAVAK